jgi:atrophin-1 interacting protein 3 (BAI1-associated protein 1)
LGVFLKKTPSNYPKIISNFEFLPIFDLAGGMGFGFTIADSAFGQKVKKILDRPRCKTLQEGDVLIEINGKSVRGMSHSEVVQVLKECTRGSEANISIQRGLLPPGSGM